MAVTRIIVGCTFLCLGAQLLRAEKTIGRLKRSLFYPPSSGMGMFLALAIPVDLPQYELSLSYNFEANYLLPDNLTELELGPQFTQIRYARSLTRSRVYDLLEGRLDSLGYTGRACLLRTICETAANPLEEHNGLLGDLLHLIFTPSTSQLENLPQEFQDAEENGHGRSTENCADLYPDCPLDLYSLITIWKNEDNES